MIWIGRVATPSLSQPSLLIPVFTINTFRSNFFATVSFQRIFYDRQPAPKREKKKEWFGERKNEGVTVKPNLVGLRLREGTLVPFRFLNVCERSAEE